ncbi:MAG: lipase family protein, partial [Acidimicrobiales bacterium]
EWTTMPNAFRSPTVAQIIAENSLGHATPTAPTFFYNGIYDELVWIKPLDALVASYCAAGAKIDYYRDPAGLEHIQGVANFAPLALSYLDARFAGGPVPDTCGAPGNSGPPPIGMPG